MYAGIKKIKNEEIVFLKKSIYSENVKFYAGNPVELPQKASVNWRIGLSIQ